ncbi:hydrolase 1, exosortase A system-associated [Chromatium okenii]|uniref:hydrolase 1, exosortase A system-associated n=1 Tax=Chromatium okenii TaxID=61644 RepID=UPI0019070088|nr:hydrolase 1, exosortase A system-associated [Chromatium okenii]MBK1642406.1 hydrolase 1, exosortase A system-associated [Chromatium okenii]
MNFTEQPLVFQCADERLIGIIAQPNQHAVRTGVVIVVGGPQYRAGSHRQFTLLARDLAQKGISSLRFDYRGMGDSEGELRTFMAIDADIKAAIDTLLQQVPSVESVIIWGLCDAAAAALMYAPQDARVSGLVLLNPWVHTEATAARVRLTHYYVQRLTQPAFWRKLVSGRFAFLTSWRDVLYSLRSTVLQSTDDRIKSAPQTAKQSHSFVIKMREGLQCFKGQVLFILSGNDLTAQEFISLTERDRHWRTVLQNRRVSQQLVPQANHTFSSEEWRTVVSTITVNFIVRGDQT